jgi:hypothetical protein
VIHDDYIESRFVENSLHLVIGEKINPEKKINIPIKGDSIGVKLRIHSFGSVYCYCRLF